MRRIALMLALACTGALFIGAGTASATPGGVKPVVYTNIPKSLAPNYPSQPFQAQQTSQLGDEVQFAAGTTNQLKQVNLVMSSWACQQGTWFNGCVTNPGAKFAVPITLTVYNVGVADTPGTVIATSTKTFKIPFRPSADATCAAPEKYKADDGNCYNGKAVRISFAFDGQTLPGDVIWGVSYNTSGYGPNPKGYGNPCNSTIQGCPYDSLNVALGSADPTRGIDLHPAGAFLNSATAGVYCDGGVAGINLFRLDDGCWAGFNPMIQFKVFD